MKTLVYIDYYNAFTRKILDVKNVNFNVRLVSESYTPDPTHLPEDVDSYILNGISVIIEDDISKLTMSEITKKIKAKMEIGFKEFPDEICSELNSVVLLPDKIHELKNAITEFSNNGEINLWETLAECGIKYFVIESVDLGILCFCINIES